MTLWEHRQRPDIQFYAKPTENGLVEVWCPTLRPGGEFLMRHLWAYCGEWDRDAFVELYKPSR